MDDKQIQQILKSQLNSEQRSSFRCPEENKLASYVDGQMTGSERTTFERHVSDCQSCLAAIAFLTRSTESDDSKQIPRHLVTRARSLVTQKPVTKWRWSWAIATAAAACLVLALSFVILRSRTQPPTGSVDGPLVAQNQPTPEPVVSPS
ncbi:MAG TPA: zf-HC2 domain-containing protein, partial [Pyrinomonadaceae bacterium]|nr:zf-HC2 domain-containing protein [Pyrinomonadaceae bacterium]